MSDDTITGQETLEEVVKEHTLDSEVGDLNLKVTLEIDELDLETGMLSISYEVGGDPYFDEWYLPSLLGWHPPDTKVTSVPFEVSAAVGDILEDAVADAEGIDPENVSVQSIKAVNTVEWVDSSDLRILDSDADTMEDDA